MMKLHFFNGLIECCKAVIKGGSYFSIYKEAVEELKVFSSFSPKISLVNSN
ncbi:hypothetical protein VAS14_09504 [Photobacterium angustum S14]|uniref:Uncharacterized protein n=1 Tax=Photobacterium angustum (strain S14 / CCUG 15956) TaxID=314292 RepID=Q1ZX24_PHOAS|nr:hypothetical protein VAS14_09504 [Photobacterium angustum S14]